MRIVSHKCGFVGDAMAAGMLSSPRLHLALRLACALLGGYAFTWGFIALGMEFHDAEHLSSMLGLLLYLAVFLWAFAARSLRRAAWVLLGGGAVMAALASAVQWGLV